MKMISVGSSSSKGIAIAKAYVVKKINLEPYDYRITESEIDNEIIKLDQAIGEAVMQIEKLVEESDIFAGHMMIAKDIMLRDRIISKIQRQKNIEIALLESIEEFVKLIEDTKDAFIRERSADIRDVGERIFRIIRGGEDKTNFNMKEKVILVAEDLSPSDIVSMDLNYVLGLITEEGGVNNHVSILARNIGLPILVGVKGVINQVKNQDVLIMDGLKGIVIINPDKETIKEYEMLRMKDLEGQKQQNHLTELASITLDNKKVKLMANASSIEEVKSAVANHAEGIGLYRTELLYMKSSYFPSEDELFAVYRETAKLCQGEVIIRTFDIGGDKSLPYYRLHEEGNPFLGQRGIRVLLNLKDEFKTQLRAILKASAYGRIKILFPMIVSVEEWEGAIVLLNQCKQDLRDDNIDFDEDIDVGIMVETPAAVMNIESFAKRCDFFSIGTNDLTQYILAVDRNNQSISNYYNTFHPAVLKSIKHIIEVAHKFHKRVGICGEFASEPKAVRLLLGMGMDEFSVSSKDITRIKEVIRHTRVEDASKIAEMILTSETINDVMDRILLLT